MTFRFRGSRVFLVGRKSRRGGRALVIVNGKRKRVSFASKRTRDRAILFSTPVKRGGRLTLKVLRGRVEVDALGALRP